VDAADDTVYAYTGGGQLFTETGPFASDTVTNTYVQRMRVALSLYPVRYRASDRASRPRTLAGWDVRFRFESPLDTRSAW